MRQIVLLVSFLAACATPVGVRNTEVPRDAAPQCANICQSMGLPLDSVVVMADNVGCVCRAAQPQGMAPGAVGASSGGMAAVLMAQAAAQQKQNRQSYQPPAATGGSPH